MSKNLWPSKRSSVLGIAKILTGPILANRVDGPILANRVDGPISLLIFWPKIPGQLARHEQGYFHDARSKNLSKGQVFSDVQRHVTLPIFPNKNAGLLFDLVVENQSELFSSVG
jgi:hypothetical protein